MGDSAPPSSSGPESTTSPPPPVQHDPTAARELVCGPSQIGPPYPLYLQGAVQKGFGRGSKDLGCPTANLPDEAIEKVAALEKNGVYFGWAKVKGDQTREMVMSVGWNPVYKNEKRTAEVHILHEFGHDFYGEDLRVIVLGFIRPEYNYSSLDALIKDINLDKEATWKSLDRPAYRAFRTDPFFDN